MISKCQLTTDIEDKNKWMNTTEIQTLVFIGLIVLIVQICTDWFEVTKWASLILSKKFTFRVIL